MKRDWVYAGRSKPRPYEEAVSLRADSLAPHL
jgi:hypothetical protein